jgi:hypothetical protein
MRRVFASPPSLYSHINRCENGKTVFFPLLVRDLPDTRYLRDGSALFSLAFAA